MNSHHILHQMPFIYNDPELDEQFIKHGKQVLHLLGQQLGLSKSDYDIRLVGRGSVYGTEVTLHSDRLYVRLLQTAIFSGRSTILYRACDHRKNFTGHRNHYRNHYRNHFCGVPDLQSRTIIAFMTEIIGNDPVGLDGPLFAFNRSF